jgi:hypothetical protein
MFSVFVRFFFPNVSEFNTNVWDLFWLACDFLGFAFAAVWIAGGIFLEKRSDLPLTHTEDTEIAGHKSIQGLQLNK